MSTVQYSWLDVFRRIVYSPEVDISPSFLAQSKLHILTSNNVYKGMSTVQHSLLAAVRRILAGLLEGDLCFGGGGTWATSLTSWQLWYLETCFLIMAIWQLWETCFCV